MKAGSDLAAGGDIPKATQEFERAKALRPWDQDIDLLAAQAFAVRAVTGDTTAAAAATTWARAAVERNPSSMEHLLHLPSDNWGPATFQPRGRRWIHRSSARRGHLSPPTFFEDSPKPAARTWRVPLQILNVLLR